MNELIYYDEIAQSVSRSAYHAQANLENLLGLLKMTICDGMWRKRQVAITGEIVTFDTFEQFVNAKPPEGLGTTISKLKWLCTVSPELLSLIEKADTILQKPPESPSATNKPNKPALYSKEWTIDQLETANRPDLTKKLLTGKMTPSEVQVEMGWRKHGKKEAPQSQSKQAKRFSKEWTLERLANTQRTDLIEKLQTGKMTPYEVQVKMGWRKKGTKATAK